MQVDSQNNHISQDKNINIHEDLAHLQQNMCLENISTTGIPTIDNIHRLLECNEGLDVMNFFFEIYHKHIPSITCTSQLRNTVVSQGGLNTPPSIVASIPTYTTPEFTTTIQ